MRARAGFTLLETTLALAIGAIAAALVAARLPDTGASALDGAATRLAAALTWGRERAVLSGTPHRLALDVAAGRWTVGRAARAAGAVVPDGRAGALPPGVRVARLAGRAGRRAGTVVAIELAPAGDALPAGIDLADAAGRTARVVLPAGGGRARVARGGGR